jgi:hypothetical protein
MFNLESKQIGAISSSIFLFGLAILFHYHSIWPDILCLIAISQGVHLFLKKDFALMFQNVILFAGLYSIFKFGFKFIFPPSIILTIVGFYVLLGAFVFSSKKKKFSSFKRRTR